MLRKCKCRQCGVEFIGGPRAFYCSSCRIERQREQGREYNRRKRMGATRELGSLDTCKVCGKLYTVCSGNQLYCPDCAPKEAEKIKREMSLRWYKSKKDIINPIRKLKRRQGMKVCLNCGIEFDTQKTCRRYCSPECYRIARNRRWTERHREKSNKEDK